jgi:sterol 14-demethylase
LIFFLAARTNIAGTWAWTLLHLVRNLEAMASFENEIAQNAPDQHGIYPLKGMPFAEACLRETGRLYTNLLTARYVTREMCGPDGIIIPKGWAVASPMAVHRDPDLYDSPDRWDPLRFLPGADGTPSNYSTLLRNVEYHQFGVGNHACPGERLSRSLLQGTLWPSLLDNYQLEVVSGVKDGEGMDGVGVKPDWGKNLGTPYAGEHEVFIKVTKRAVRLSDAPHSATIRA